MYSHVAQSCYVYTCTIYYYVCAVDSHLRLCFPLDSWIGWGYDVYGFIRARGLSICVCAHVFVHLYMLITNQCKSHHP